MTKISVIIITYNEENRIRECIKSINWVDEIVVVDALSEDKTVKIAKDMGACVFSNKWPGFVKQKKLALEKASNKWIISLDADEIVSNELAEEIKLRVGKEPCNGYYFNRLNHFLKKPIKHCGWYPDNVARCFRKDKAKLDDVNVHEGFSIEGEIRNLDGFLLHYSYDSLKQYFDKMNKYTSLEVADKLKRISNKKIGYHHLIFHPLSRFLKMYFVKKGYKDGLIGFVVCLVSTIYLFTLYAKIWEKMQKG